MTDLEVKKQQQKLRRLEMTLSMMLRYTCGLGIKERMYPHLVLFMGEKTEGHSSFKLPFQVIGTAKHPRGYKDIKMYLLSVAYQGTKKAWISSATYFIPALVLLLLDNCPARSGAENLFAIYLRFPFITLKVEAEQITQTEKDKKKSNFCKEKSAYYVWVQVNESRCQLPPPT